MRTHAGRTDARFRLRRRLLASDVTPRRAHKLCVVPHSHVALGRIEAWFHYFINHAVAGVHHPCDRAVVARHFAHPTFEIAATRLSEIIIADARRIHALRDRREPEGSRPCIFYVIVREGKFEIGRRSGTDHHFNRVALQITEDIAIDRNVIPLMQHDRVLAQVLELVVVEGDSRC